MYDIAFVGHMCYDEIVSYGGARKIAPGSAVLCGALAAAKIGKRVAAVVRMDEKDAHITDMMKKAGIDVYIIPSAKTSYMEVIHPSENVDERRMILRRNAGFFSADEMPDIETVNLHLAGISDREFSMGFIEALREKCGCMSVDMQSFIRQVDPSGEVSFKDCVQKKDIIALLDKVKLDIVEAEILTGTSNLQTAAEIIESWGCPEVVITRSEGILASRSGNIYYEMFSNKSATGRTGRGDTAFAAYLSRRMEYNVPDSLKFASALVSIKMETQGPFQGTLDDVLGRMEGSV